MTKNTSTIKKTEESNETVQPTKEENTQTEPQKPDLHRPHKRHKSLDFSILSGLQPPSIISNPSEESISSSKQQGGNKEESTNPSSLHETLETGDNANYEHEEKKSELSLDQFLGLSLESWPYSEKILASTILLKTEMERTKREHIRLQHVTQSIELVKLAVQANIPSHLIPYVFATNEHKELQNLQGGDNKENRPASKPGTSTSVFKLNVPQQQQFQFHHWQKPDGSEQRSEVSTAASTVGSSSQQRVPITPSRGEPSEIERKRRLGDDGGSDPKMVTPQNHRFQTTHRRNQSEANVSHLRSIYENRVNQQNPQYSLRSPYVYPPSDRTQAPHPPQQEAPSNMQQYQGHAQFQPNHFQCPRRSAPGTPTNPISVPQQHQQQYIQVPPQRYQFPQRQYPPPPPPPPQPPLPQQPLPQQSQLTPQRQQQQQQQQRPQHLMVQTSQQRGGADSGQGSPLSGSKSKKGDVSFLISTPNNPPK